jgi:hypothetical protein
MIARAEGPWFTIRLELSGIRFALAGPSGDRPSGRETKNQNQTPATGPGMRTGLLPPRPAFFLRALPRAPLCRPVGAQLPVPVGPWLRLAGAVLLQHQGEAVEDRAGAVVDADDARAVAGEGLYRLVAGVPEPGTGVGVGRVEGASQSGPCARPLPSAGDRQMSDPPVSGADPWATGVAATGRCDRGPTPWPQAGRWRLRTRQSLPKKRAAVTRSRQGCRGGPPLHTAPYRAPPRSVECAAHRFVSRPPRSSS